MTKIVAVCGYIGSGKSTVADIIHRKYGHHKLHMADKLKDSVSAVFGWDRVLLSGDTEESRLFRETKDEYWSTELGFEVTPRKMLQYYGTEIMRNAFHPDIWVMSLKKEITKYNSVVIPDLRFANEEKFIKSCGGKIIRIEKHSVASDHCVHESELHCPNIEHDAIIKNDGTLLDLELKVSKIMEEFEIETEQANSGHLIQLL